MFLNNVSPEKLSSKIRNGSTAQKHRSFIAITDDSIIKLDNEANFIMWL